MMTVSGRVFTTSVLLPLGPLNDVCWSCRVRLGHARRSLSNAASLPSNNSQRSPYAVRQSLIQQFRKYIHTSRSLETEQRASRHCDRGSSDVAHAGSQSCADGSLPYLRFIKGVSIRKHFLGQYTKRDGGILSKSYGHVLGDGITRKHSLREDTRRGRYLLWNTREQAFSRHDAKRDWPIWPSVSRLPTKIPAWDQYYDAREIEPQSEQRHGRPQEVYEHSDIGTTSEEFLKTAQQRARYDTRPSKPTLTQGSAPGSENSSYGQKLERHLLRKAQPASKRTGSSLDRRFPPSAAHSSLKDLQRRAYSTTAVGEGHRASFYRIILTRPGSYCNIASFCGKLFWRYTSNLSASRQWGMQHTREASTMARGAKHDGKQIV